MRSSILFFNYKSIFYKLKDQIYQLNTLLWIQGKRSVLMKLGVIVALFSFGFTSTSAQFVIKNTGNYSQNLTQYQTYSSSTITSVASGAKYAALSGALVNSKLYYTVSRPGTGGSAPADIYGCGGDGTGSGSSTDCSFMPNCGSSDLVKIKLTGMYIWKNSTGTSNSDKVTIGGSEAYVFQNQVYALVSNSTTNGRYQIYLNNECSQQTGWINAGSGGANVSILSSETTGSIFQPSISSVSSTSSSITLNWNKSNTGFTCCLSNITSGNSTSKSLSYSDNSYTFNSLNASTTYSLCLKLDYGGCSSNSTCTTVTTRTSCSLSAPSFKTSSYTANSITVNWDPISGATGYDLEICYNGYSSCNTYSTTSTSYTFSGLNSGSNYYIRIKSKNSTCNSSFSNYTVYSTCCQTSNACLVVYLNPSGVGQWNLDGGSWQNSGTLLTGISPGTHTINFKPVSGYITPASQTYNYSACNTWSLNGTYIIGSSSPPVANFSVNKTHISAGSSVTFTEQSSNSPTSWEWTIAGGAPYIVYKHTTQNPSRTFPRPGAYTVTLKATNSAFQQCYPKQNFEICQTSTFRLQNHLLN